MENFGQKTTIIKLQPVQCYILKHKINKDIFGSAILTMSIYVSMFFCIINILNLVGVL